MRLKKARKFERRAALLLDAEGGRLHPAMDEIRRMRIEAGAEDVAELFDHANDRRVSGDHAAKHIIMSGEVFRRAMDDEIDPKLGGAHIHGRREGAIDERFHAMLFTDRGHAAEVDDGLIGIRRELADDEFGLGTNRGLERAQITRRDERRLNAKAIEEMRHKLTR